MRTCLEASVKSCSGSWGCPAGTSCLHTARTHKDPKAGSVTLLLGSSIASASWEDRSEVSRLMANLSRRYVVLASTGEEQKNYLERVDSKSEMKKRSS